MQKKTIIVVATLGLSVAAGVGMGALSCIWKYKGFPAVHEYPIFFSPIFSYIVAMSVFMTYLLDDEVHGGQNTLAIRITCLAGMLWSFTWCSYLTFFHSWGMHLTLVLILFCGFLLW